MLSKKTNEAQDAEMDAAESAKTPAKSSAEMGTFVDPRDGTEYKTCKIGNQVWLAENLKYELNSNDCFVYDEDYQYFDKFGYLYTSKGAEKAIPEGWHLPTEEEWETLIRFAKKNGRCKEAIQVLASKEWKKSSSDKFGFSLLPGGRGVEDDEFSEMDLAANFWCQGKGWLTKNPVLWPVCFNEYDEVEFISSDVYAGDTTAASIRLVKD